MKNILMMHYDLMFYRIPFYNLLKKTLEKYDYNLIIWFYDLQSEVDRTNLEFEYIDNKSLEMNMKNYKKVLKDKKILKVINFLNPGQPGYSFYIQMILYTFMQRKELIYYGHGINLEKQNNTLMNSLYNILHLFYKSIILYTPNEKKFLWKQHHKKVHIAYNTLSLSGYEELLLKNKDILKKELGFQANDKIVLFSGRIQERKRLDILLDIFDQLKSLNVNTMKLLIVGPGMTEEYEKRVEDNHLIFSMGPIYDKTKMSHIFYCSDIFCIPGHIGLGLIEAMYWGTPVFTMNVKHAPEIYYLENGKNGYMVDSKEELFNLISSFSKDVNQKELNLLASNARETYISKALPELMVNGFVSAIKEDK